MADIVDKDHGFNALQKLLASMSTKSVYAGLPGDVDSDIIVAATANEFGTRDIPERSTFRAVADTRGEEILDLSEDLAGRIVDGDMDGEQALGLMGEFVVGLIKTAIVDLRDPPNAASTIAAKGSSNPLIDSGRTRASVTWEIR